MSALVFIGLGLLMVLAIGWSILHFFSDFQRAVAPDNADRDAINARFGEGTPEAREALNKRFGPDSHWRDAATGLSGLAGLALLYWIWFG